jgi:7-cyano-7-deazaguanine synthase
MNNTALVILSGGQDSTTCLYWALQNFGAVHAISFDYGQSHLVELAAAQQVAAMAGVRSHELVMLGGALRGTSPLIDREKPLETYADFESMDAVIGDRVELTFVPMRNLLFLTIAANRAVCLGAGSIITGICQADNANYPDCRDIFALDAERAINTALGIERNSDRWLSVITPLMDLTKADSVRLAANIPGCLEALGYSHTCYAGRVPPCGECHACILRAHGFAEAGIEDPLIARTSAHA